MLLIAPDWIPTEAFAETDGAVFESETIRQGISISIHVRNDGAVPRSFAATLYVEPDEREEP